MAEELGSGYVSILPSMRGFSRMLERELKKELRGHDISVPVKADVDRNHLTSSGRDAGTALGGAIANSAGDTFAGAFRNVLSSALSGGGGLASTLASNPVVLAIGAALGAGIIAAASAAIGAAIASGALLAGGIGTLSVGILFIKDDPRVQAEAQTSLNIIKEVFRSAAEPLVAPLVKAIGMVQSAAVRLQPTFERIFTRLAPLIEPLTAGFIKLVENALPGFEAFLIAADPLIRTLADHMPTIGTALSIFFATIAKSGPEANVFLDDILTALAGAIVVFGVAIAELTKLYVWFRDVFKSVKGFVFDAAVAVANFGARIGTFVTDAIAKVKELGTKAKDAVKNFGTLLFDAGRNVVQGLIDGIKNKFGALTTAASSMAGIIRNFLPFSPAKMGPLSGSGNPFHSGQVIAGDLASGMKSQLPTVRGAADQLAGSVAFGGTSSRAVAPADAPTVAVAGDQVMQALLNAIKEAIRRDNGGDVVLRLGS